MRPEGGDAVGVHGIEEVGSLNVEVGETPEGLVGLSAHDKSPAAVAGLHRLISRGFDGLSFIEGSAGGVVDSCGDFQRETDGDVASVFCWRTEDPGLSPDGDVAKAADLKDAGGRIDLVASAVVDGDVGDDAPARRELIFEADVEDVLVISDGRAAGDLLVADEVLVGVEDAIPNVDGEIVNGETAGSALVRRLEELVDLDELIHGSLVGMCGDASLGEGVIAAHGCRECD